MLQLGASAATSDGVQRGASWHTGMLPDTISYCAAQFLDVRLSQNVTTRVCKLLRQSHAGRVQHDLEDMLLAVQTQSARAPVATMAAGC